jgi:hypothetical protein
MADGASVLRGVLAMSTLALGASLFLGCSSNDHAPRALGGDPFDAPAVDASDGGASGFDVKEDGGELNCAATLEADACACTEIGAHPPTLYILLDHSGSMNEVVAPATVSKWNQIRSALLDASRGALRKLGSRVAVGTAYFPANGLGVGCTPGAEVFPVRVGSPATYDALATTLSTGLPDGATPTASSIAAIKAKLVALPKPVYLLLATDGAPNCGTGTCTADRCQYDIEHTPLSDGTPCTPPLNCCDPSKVSGGSGWSACLDSEATRVAIETLLAAGIPTFVLGTPGLAPEYGADLDALALAGGTAQPAGSGPRYYAASDTPTLESALAAIAGKVVDSCVVNLDAPVLPEDRGITNVLLDGVPVAQDDVNGWSWTDDDHIELHGAACDQIKAGTVSSVQVAVGCKTITR